MLAEHLMNKTKYVRDKMRTLIGHKQIYHNIQSAATAAAELFCLAMFH
jgi:hypothetical protein